MSGRLTVRVGHNSQTTALAYTASAAARVGATFVFAHGAGAPQQHPFMVGFALGLAARGVDVVTFNFLYTEQQRRIPDRVETLEACYRAAIDAAHRHEPISGNAIFIGGKSMGGRIATHLAAAAGDDRAILITTREPRLPNPDSRIPNPGPRIPLSGVICLGYPLHPPGKPEQRRAAHLPGIRVPMLFVQGERDTFGTPGELRPIIDTLTAEVTLHVVERGDHSLAPSKRKEVIAATYDEVQNVIAAWMRQRRAVASEPEPEPELH